MEYNAFLMSRNSTTGTANSSNNSGSRDNLNGTGNEDAMIEESYLPSDITAYFALAQMKSIRKISFPECLVSKTNNVLSYKHL